MVVRVTFKVGDLVTNGSSAGEIVEWVERDPRWKVPGWRIRNIPTEQFGGNPHMTSFVADYLIKSWKVIAVDQWYPEIGGDLEARYVWAPGHHHLQRELRTLRAS